MNKSESKNTKFDSIICLNGDLPSKEEFQKFNNIPLIVADGAYNYLYKNDIKVNYLVGDMDSVDKSIKICEKTEYIENKNQDTNDFEKCILTAIKLNFKNLLVIGINGGILEHTLNNMSVLIKYTDSLFITVYHNNRYCIYCTHNIEINSYQGEIISIIPFPKARLSTENLKWNLTNENLEMGIREGARNICLSDKFSIKLFEGSYFLFFDSNLPYLPEFKII